MARPLPQPNVAVVDLKTGLMTPPWYEYFVSRDRTTAGVGGGSGTAVWFYGSVAPSNALGLEGDFYMLLNPTTHAIIAVRIKQGGVWV